MVIILYPFFFWLNASFGCSKIHLYELKVLYTIHPLFSFISSGSDDDLEYYVRECGDILGVTSNLPQDSRDAKHILEYIFTQVVEFKKLNQVHFSLIELTLCQRVNLNSILTVLIVFVGAGLWHHSVWRRRRVRPVLRTRQQDRCPAVKHRTICCELLTPVVVVEYLWYLWLYLLLWNKIWWRFAHTC